MSALKISSEKEYPSRVSDREGEQKVRACEKLKILEGRRVCKVQVKVPSGRMKESEESSATTGLPTGH